MVQVPVNYMAVIAAAVVNMVIGYVWHGPLFGKKWAALMGFNSQKMDEAKKKGMTKAYIIMAIGSLIMAYVLAHVLVYSSTYMETSGVSAGMTAGFWIWLGFVAPVTLGTVLWEGKPWKLWVINAGYYLVSLLVMGSLLSYWM